MIHGTTETWIASVTIVILAVVVWTSVKQTHDSTNTVSPSVVSVPPCISAFQVSLFDVADGNDLDTTTDHYVRHEREASFDRTIEDIHTFYHNAVTNSTISHHFFVRMAPASLQDSVRDILVWNNPAVMKLVQALIVAPTIDRSQQNHGDYTYVLDSYDEIYIMRPEQDLVDPHKMHYDGNLRIPHASVCTIRALMYLEGPTAPLVALSSRKEFVTHPGRAIILDFNNELHYANFSHLLTGNNLHNQYESQSPRTAFRSSPEPRIMVKTALHVVRPGTSRPVSLVYIWAHRLIFFAIKSVRSFLEKDSASDWERLLGLAIDNAIRSLNKIHMALPLLVVGGPLLGVILVAPWMYPLQFLPYMLQILALCLRMFHPVLIVLASLVMTVVAHSDFLQAMTLSMEKPWRTRRSLILAGIALYGVGVMGPAVAWLHLLVDSTSAIQSLLPATTIHRFLFIQLLALLVILCSGGGGSVGNYGVPTAIGGRPRRRSQRLKWPRLLVMSHLAWIGITGYMEAHCDMAHHILLAPITTRHLW